MFIKPMLAAPIRNNKGELRVAIRPGTHVAERKYDGHRLIVEVLAQALPGKDLFSPRSRVRAWSRDGLDRELGHNLTSELNYLPAGIYDGELCSPNDKNYGVTVIEDREKLVLYVFDVLALLGQDVRSEAWTHRRMLLEQALSKTPGVHVQVSEVHPVDSIEDVMVVAEQIWDRQCEGLIVKSKTAPYLSDKRKFWYKVKRWQSAALRVVGFEASKGTVLDHGPFAVVLLKDDDGNRASVKTRNGEERAKLEYQARHAQAGQHPAIGRLLRIEYAARTPDGRYLQPHWDRWEDE